MKVSDWIFVFELSETFGGLLYAFIDSLKAFDCYVMLTLLVESLILNWICDETLFIAIKAPNINRL